MRRILLVAGTLALLAALAPGVAHARRGEWRRMHADHRYSLRIFDACAHLNLR